MKAKIACYSMISILTAVALFAHPVCSKNISEEEQLILVGIGAYSDGFYDIAEKQFSQFIKDFPNHGKIYDVCYLLGRTLLNQKKVNEARKVFSRIVNEARHFEYMDYAVFWMAQIETTLGKGEDAHKLLSSIIKRFPKFEWIDHCYYRLGLLDFRSNKFTSAESSFKKVSLLSKNKELIRFSWFWLGLLFYKQNNFEASAAYLKTILEDSQSVPQEYLRHALFLLAESQLRLGRFDDAKLTYKAFYEQFRSDPLMVDAYWRLGFCEYRLGNIKEAIEIFQAFKKEFKDSQLISYAHYLLGEIFLFNGDSPSSLKEFNLILNQPKGNVLWGASGIAIFWNYVYLEEMDEANKMFQKLQKLNAFEDEKIFLQWLNAEIIFSEGRIFDALPYYFNILNTRYRERALFQIGKGYFVGDKLREAATNLDILLLEFPNSKYFEESLFVKGECLIQLGNFDGALEAYDLIVKQNRTNPWLLFSLTQSGNLYLSRDENDKAEVLFKRILHDFPNHALFSHAALQLGNLSFKRKNLAEAISFYSLVLKGNIRDLFGEASFGLGEIFYQEGKYEKALANFELAVQYLKETSLWFFLTQLEIGNLQKKWGKYEEAKKSYRIIIEHSTDGEIRRAAKELLDHVDSP
jgi:cellulose synthase operon protein C